MTKDKINQFNKTPQYPLTYGDLAADEEVRLSDYVVRVLKNEKLQSHMASVFFALLALGSYAAPSSAIPVEYGEAAANAAQGIGETLPPLGEIAGTGKVAQAANNAQQGAQLPNNLGGVGQPGNVGFNPVNQGGPQFNNFGAQQPPIQPVKPPAWRLPGPPMSAVGQYTNTIFLISSVGWICLNASWGNPVFAYGCVGIVGGLINELRKKCL